MKEFIIKQKMLRMNGQFNVKDEQGNDVYEVEGSFLKIPKTYTIQDAEANEVARITKKAFSFLPTFHLEVEGQETVTIQKEFSFLKPRYTIDAPGIEVLGTWWEMSFDVLKDGEVAGTVDKKWFQWGDSYQVQIYNEDLEKLIIALVIAIDCVKSDQSAASAASF
ncbi:LURP-one-related/scramblase family protein [Sporosarcina gallistercoris]|uniref:LURP-one-related family protein n=1 Tax=Sporosarcina gallistercoris TaxID=2762245 RepID=A0ABR8PJZ3_9BACL|nr:LURP-one-related family protein [Sporosarcina gallistercoris]MBD7908510.1 LURP-one-related family protein [Sporosarcina gallistercoris]